VVSWTRATVPPPCSRRSAFNRRDTVWTGKRPGAGRQRGRVASILGPPVPVPAPVAAIQSPPDPATPFREAGLIGVFEVVCRSAGGGTPGAARLLLYGPPGALAARSGARCSVIPHRATLRRAVQPDGAPSRAGRVVARSSSPTRRPRPRPKIHQGTARLHHHRRRAVLRPTRVGRAWDEAVMCGTGGVPHGRAVSEVDQRCRR
jgi:hypothetical protein